MPLVSQAQWRKFASLVASGDMKKSVFDEWTKASKPFHELPDRVKPAKAPAAKQHPLQPLKSRR